MDPFVHEVMTRREILTHNYFHILAVSFLFYDHSITFGDEVNHIWLRPKSRSSYWFLLNRYFAFFGNVVVLLLGFMDLTTQVGGPFPGVALDIPLNNPSFSSCKRFNLFRQMLLILNQVIVCILLTARIYALYGCSIRILLFMIGLGAGLMAVSCWQLIGQKGSPSETVAGCHIAFSKITSIRFAAAWEALFVYDTMIFVLTVFKTWTARRDHAITGINIPIISLLLRDGAIYFIVMALCNLANILTFYLSGPFMRGGLSTFASSISVCMMARLMLNLHETADAGIYSMTTTMERHPDDTLDIVHPSAISVDSQTANSVRRKSR